MSAIILDYIVLMFSVFYNLNTDRLINIGNGRIGPWALYNKAMRMFNKVNDEIKV